jgi:hypothetical protein
MSDCSSVTTEQKAPQVVLRLWQHGAIFLLACALVISRRPDAVFHAQFWDEDGRIFFAEAYNFGGWAAFLRTYAGYFDVLPRLGAALALLVPLSLAPLVLNVVAIFVQALPVNFLLSSRSSAWGSLRFRALLAGIYLGLPNCLELNATITNSQWRLALSAFLLLVASRPRSTERQIFDCFILLLCGLTGPFCVFLFPIAFSLAWKYRDRWRWAVVGILGVTCLIQAWGLFSGGYAGRPSAPLGVSATLFVRAIAGQLYIGGILGPNSLAAYGGVLPVIAFTGIAVAGTIFVALCFARSSREMKLFLVFSGVVLAAGLIAPTPGQIAGTTGWAAMVRGAGARYWFFPDLAFAWSILFCFQSQNQALKAVSVILLCFLCFGIAARWEYPAFQDANFAEYAGRFESAPVGTIATIPESTPGWSLQLIKHGSK